MGLPILCGAFAATAAASALLGWAIGDESLKRIFPSFVAMNPATATCLVLAGLALALLRISPVSSRALAAFVAVITAAQLFGFLFDAGPDVAQLLFRDS